MLRTHMEMFNVSPNETTPLLTLAQVCEHCAVSRSTVKRAIRRGDLSTIHFGRSVRIDRRALTAWVFRNATPAPSI